MTSPNELVTHELELAAKARTNDRRMSRLGPPPEVFDICDEMSVNNCVFAVLIVIIIIIVNTVRCLPIK